MVERRLADPGLGEKGVEAQASFSRDLTESDQIDTHGMIVPKNRTEYNPSINGSSSILETALIQGE
jgi:hypothetical protein